MTTFINNKGIVQTRLRRNNRQQNINELKWNANYDGKHAIVKVDVAKDGDKKKYRINLDNNDFTRTIDFSEPKLMRQHAFMFARP